ILGKVHGNPRALNSKGSVVGELSRRNTITQGYAAFDASFCVEEWGVVTTATSSSHEYWNSKQHRRGEDHHAMLYLPEADRTEVLRLWQAHLRGAQYPGGSPVPGQASHDVRGLPGPGHAEAYTATRIGTFA